VEKLRVTLKLRADVILGQHFIFNFFRLNIFSQKTTIFVVQKFVFCYITLCMKSFNYILALQNAKLILKQFKISYSLQLQSAILQPTT